MSVVQTVILSIIEGITEFLPISSTGHLILAARVLGIAQTEAQKTVEIAMQMGAILAVVVLYARMLLTERRTLLLVLAAFVPTGMIGLFLHALIKELLGNVTVVLWSLLIGGIVLVFFEKLRPAKNSASSIREMTVAQAFLVGVFQSVALVPGVSRAAATIVGGELIGISRRTIVEFSFLLAIPTMAAAAGYDLVRTAGEFSGADVQALIMGFILSFVVALGAIKWFLAYVQQNSLVAFGMYRIFLAVIFFFLWQ